MIAVIKQATVEKINHEVLQHELGVPTKNAAQMRWSRFQAKLKQASSGTVVTYNDADLTLMLAVLNQIAVGKLDFGVLQQKLGVPTKNAAQMRWSRFQAKLKNATGASRSNVAGPSAAPKMKKATPKKRKDREEADESDKDKSKFTFQSTIF